MSGCNHDKCERNFCKICCYCGVELQASTTTLTTDVEGVDFTRALTGDVCVSTPPSYTVTGLFIKAFQTKVHNLAKEKGWYDPPKTDLECMALIHSEISEAVEELRSKEEKPYLYQTYQPTPMNTIKYVEPTSEYWHPKDKPEGLASELADAVIRILDYCEWKGIDLEQAIKLKHEYNKTRPFRHNKKL